MIVGVGMDIVEIGRIQSVLARQPRFPRRILTTREQEFFLQLSKHHQLEFLAERLAAKEAFSKALGTGIGRELSFQDIEILPGASNKLITTSKIFKGTIHLSISHAHFLAIAQVILEKKDRFENTV